MYKTNENSRPLAKSIVIISHAKLLYNTHVKALYFPRPSISSSCMSLYIKGTGNHTGGYLECDRYNYIFQSMLPLIIFHVYIIHKQQKWGWGWWPLVGGMCLPIIAQTDTSSSSLFISHKNVFLTLC